MAVASALLPSLSDHHARKLRLVCASTPARAARLSRILAYRQLLALYLCFSFYMHNIYAHILVIITASLFYPIVAAVTAHLHASLDWIQLPCDTNSVSFDTNQASFDTKRGLF
jgi:hypothetical protein